MAGRIRTGTRPAAQRYRLIRTRHCPDAILLANAARVAVAGGALPKREASRVANAEPPRYSVWCPKLRRQATRQYEKCGLEPARLSTNDGIAEPSLLMRACDGFNGDATNAARAVGCRPDAVLTGRSSRRRSLYRQQALPESRAILPSGRCTSYASFRLSGGGPPDRQPPSAPLCACADVPSALLPRDGPKKTPGSATRITRQLICSRCRISPG